MVRARAVAAALAAALAALLGAAACADHPLAPELPQAGPPEALDVRLAGFFLGLAHVRLVGDTLVLVRQQPVPSSPPSLLYIVPRPEEWRAFWQAVDAAGIRGWPARCDNSDVLDASGYEMRLAYGDGARIEATGYGSAPRRDGRCSTSGSEEYEAFLAAMSRLLGRPFPGR